MANKYTPQQDKEYILTDQCYWQQLSSEEQEAYNPYDSNRAPHGVSLVDPETGTIVNILSGSIIKVIKTVQQYEQPTGGKQESAN